MHSQAASKIQHRMRPDPSCVCVCECVCVCVWVCCRRVVLSGVGRVLAAFLHGGFLGAPPVRSVSGAGGLCFGSLAWGSGWGWLVRPAGSLLSPRLPKRTRLGWRVEGPFCPPPARCPAPRLNIFLIALYFSSRPRVKCPRPSTLPRLGPRNFHRMC